MTIKIIHKGKIPEPKTWQQTCNCCNTVFTYQEEDVSRLLNPDIFGSWLICPLCEKQQPVYLPQIPYVELHIYDERHD